MIDHMATSLEQLPEELLQHMLDSLAPQDIYNIRLTCRALEIKSKFTLKQRLFRTRGYQFSQSGIESLLQIAENQTFAPWVEKLTIVLERWNHWRLHAALWEISKRHNIKRIQNPFQSFRLRRFRPAAEEESQEARDAAVAAAADEFKREIGDRLAFVEQRQDLEVLSKAVSLLPRLRTIELKEVGDGHCFQAGSLEGVPCGSGVSRAWPILGEEMGGFHRIQLLERHHLFRLLLSALALNHETSQGNPQLEALDICVSDYEYANPPSSIAPSLTKSLQSLSLIFIASYHDVRSHRFGQPDPFQTSSENRPDRPWLLGFVQSCSRLKRLDLDFHDYYFARRIAEIGNVVHIPALEHFSLRGSLLDFRDERIHGQLEAFLLSHKATLKSLYLSDIKTGWSIIPSPCYTTKDLLQTMTRLERLEEVRLMRFTENSLDDLVTFEPQSEHTKKGNDAWMFKGTPKQMIINLDSLSRNYEVAGRR